MARKQARPKATHEVTLDLLQKTCRSCGKPLRMVRHGHRKVTTLEGIRRYRRAYRNQRACLVKRLGRADLY
jgi:hypothetical protein